MFSENPDKHLDSIQSPADVDQLIAKRIEYAKTQKAEDLAKDSHLNVSSVISQNYESINADLDLTQESVDTKYIEESNSDSDREEEIQILDLSKCEIIDEIDLRELEQIPHAMVKEGKLEGFMSEEEIEFQDIDICKKVELPHEQGIEECIDRKKCVIRLLEIPVRIAYEQEECIEEEICDMSLPKLYRAEESVHTNEIKLETHKKNAVGNK